MPAAVPDWLPIVACLSAIAVTSVDLASSTPVRTVKSAPMMPNVGASSAAAESVLVAELRISPAMVLCCWAKRLIAAGSA